MGILEEILKIEQGQQPSTFSELLGIRSRSSWNDRFDHWQRPESLTEQGTIERAWNKVDVAVRKNSWLMSEGVTLLPQGSYHNRTNVRREADIDLRLVHPSIQVQYAPSVFYPTTYHQQKYSSLPLTYAQISDRMRLEIIDALRNEFGDYNLDTSGNKAIAVKGQTGSTAKIDVVPAFVLDYVTQHSILSEPVIAKGVAILGRDGQFTYNFPEQHTANGRAKRERTAHRFKKMVRIFKRIRDELKSSGIKAANVPSFLIECLVYNVADEHFLFTSDDNYGRVKRIAQEIYTQAHSPFSQTMAKEISGLKMLYGTHQAWTLEQTKAFTSAVLSHLGDA